MQEFFQEAYTDISALLSRASVLYQFAIIIALLIASFILGRLTRPRLEHWINERWVNEKSLPKAVSEFFNIISAHLHWLIFMILAWITRFAMLQITWPAKSYFIKMAATLGLAFFAIALISAFVETKTLRRLFRWAAGIWALVYIIGYSDETMAALDKIAFEFGSTRISLLLILKTIIILSLLLGLARMINTYLLASINKNKEFSPAARVLMSKITAIIIYTLAILIALRFVGIDLTSLAILSGAVAFGVGFGMQKIVSNLIAGVLLLLDKSIKPGDVITVGETYGWITSLRARYALVSTRDGREHLIPNEDLITNQVVNWSHSNDRVRLDVHFGVSYDANPHQVIALVTSAIQDIPRVLSAPKPPVCFITNFGDSSVDFVLRFWISDPSGGLTNIRGAVYLKVWDVLHEAGIEIPFPQRDLNIKGLPENIAASQEAMPAKKSTAKK